MLKKIILFLLIFLVNVKAQSRDVKIIEILDANLFETEDSLLIRMINLKVPSLLDQDSTKIEMAKTIIKFADLHLLNRTSLFIASTKKSCSEEDIESGHLFRKYPLSNKNINGQYLEKGYAIYLPCDTLFMNEYRKASEKAIEKKKGVWSPIKEIKKPDYFNRLRGTLWHVPSAMDLDHYIPLLGLNYRWSNLYSLVDYNSLKINLSAEAGTFFYFFLPYANIGNEFRFKKTYVRGHYDVLLPLFLGSDVTKGIGFYGFDVGFIIPVGKRSGIEVEFNLKNFEGYTLHLISISFTTY